LERVPPVLGGKLYVVGGFSGAVTASVLAYDPLGNRWITKATLPSARLWLVAAKVLIAGQPRIVAVGGELGGFSTDETDVYTP
jgi:hypothetical protein